MAETNEGYQIQAEITSVQNKNSDAMCLHQPKEQVVEHKS